MDDGATLSSPLRWDFHPMQWIRVRMSHGVRETDGKAGCHRGEMEKWNKICFHCRATDCQILLWIHADGFTQRIAHLTCPLKRGAEKQHGRRTCHKQRSSIPLKTSSPQRLSLLSQVPMIYCALTWRNKRSRALPCLFFFPYSYRTMSDDLISTCPLEIVPVKKKKKEDKRFQSCAKCCKCQETFRFQKVRKRKGSRLRRHQEERRGEDYSASWFITETLQIAQVD